MAEITVKGAPTSADWGRATVTADGHVECPVCYSLVLNDSVERHTTWHQQSMEVLRLIAR